MLIEFNLGGGGYKARAEERKPQREMNCDSLCENDEFVKGVSIIDPTALYKTY